MSASTIKRSLRQFFHQAGADLLLTLAILQRDDSDDLFPMPSLALGLRAVLAALWPAQAFPYCHFAIFVRLPPNKEVLVVAPKFILLYVFVVLTASGTRIKVNKTLHCCKFAIPECFFHFKGCLTLW
jgi:hypothetical protein